MADHARRAGVGLVRRSTPSPVATSPCFGFRPSGAPLEKLGVQAPGPSARPIVWPNRSSPPHRAGGRAAPHPARTHQPAWMAEAEPTWVVTTEGRGDQRTDDRHTQGGTDLP